MQPPRVGKYLFPIILFPFVLVLLAVVQSGQGPLTSHPPEPKPNRTPIEPVKPSPTPRVAEPSPPLPKKSATPSPPLIEQALEADRKRLELARANYQRVRGGLDARLLEQFGGDDWQRIQALEMESQSDVQSDVVIQRLNDATKLWSKLRRELPGRQRSVDLQRLQTDGKYGDYLRLLLQSKNAETDSSVESQWAEVTRWTATRWLDLARHELTSMAPDDPGFAEVALAFADYHDFAGDTDVARRLHEDAWSRVARMTDPKRAAESSILILQRTLATTPESRVKTRISECVQLALQIPDPVLKSERLADLSSLFRNRGWEAEAQSALEQALAVTANSRLDLRSEWRPILRCRAAARTESAQVVFDHCVSIPKFRGSGYDSFPAHTLGYAYAAQAGNRNHQPTETLRSILLAEAHQLESTGMEKANLHARRILAETDLLQLNWRRALISAQNLPDRDERSSVVFEVMISAPQVVPRSLALEAIQTRSHRHLAVLALSHYGSQFFSDDASLRERLAWIVALKQPSIRAAGYIGIARATAMKTAPKSPVTMLHRPQPVANDFRSLLETAEYDAKLLQMPLERAWANAWIAACWKQHDQPASYRRTWEEAHANLFIAWQNYWRNENPDSDFRRNQQRMEELSWIVECYLGMAEIQTVLLRDAEGAMRTCVDAARAAENLTETKYDARSRLHFLIQANHRQCGLPPGLFDSEWNPPNHYLRMLEAATHRDLPNAEKHLRLIELEGPGDRYEKPACLARGYAELAILYARIGKIPEYRTARRKAMSLIESNTLTDSQLFPLAEADAYAGELELAMKVKRTTGRLPLYGSIARPRAALCQALSAAKRYDEALQYLPLSSEPYWRMQAIQAIGAACRQHEPKADPTTWITSLREPLDRIAAMCGYATPRPKP